MKQGLHLAKYNIDNLMYHDNEKLLIIIILTIEVKYIIQEGYWGLPNCINLVWKLKKIVINLKRFLVGMEKKQRVFEKF